MPTATSVLTPTPTPNPVLQRRLRRSKDRKGTPSASVRQLPAVFFCDILRRYEILCDGCPGVVLPTDCGEGSMNVAFLSPPAFDSEFYSDDVSMSVGCGLWFVVCGLRFVVCGLWVEVCGLWVEVLM